MSGSLVLFDRVVGSIGEPFESRIIERTDNTDETEE